MKETDFWKKLVLGREHFENVFISDFVAENDVLPIKKFSYTGT